MSDVQPGEARAVRVRLENSRGEALHDGRIWSDPNVLPTVIIWRGGHYVRHGNAAGAVCYLAASAHYLVDPSPGCARTQGPPCAGASGGGGEGGG